MTDDRPTYRQWAHAPAHAFLPGAAYIVTASTYHKAHLLDTPAKRDCVLQTLFAEAERWGWSLEAWAVLSNHYHWVGNAPEDATTLSRLVQSLHSRTAAWLNRHDGTPGRRVWLQYWDTCLTYERSYLARLHYVHHNPAKHGVVANAENYPWCSMAWFVAGATPGHRRAVLAFPIDRVNVRDDF
ncbi:MAG: hypothetical protein GX649_10925 [Chloroflexi bacterium]|nr:hypothetical protein [Chloroflexota bacterium]